MIAILLRDRHQPSYIEVLPERFEKINAEARAVKESYSEADLYSSFNFVVVNEAGEITDWLR